MQDFEFAEQNLGKLFLLMNDYYDSLMPSEGDINGTINYLIRNYLYNSTPQLRKKIFRFYNLFVVIPKTFDWYKNENWNNKFESLIGITIEELIAFGFGFWSHWGQIDRNNLKTFVPFINKKTYFKNTILTEKKLNSALRTFCRDFRTNRAYLRKQLKQSSNWQLEFDYQYNCPLFEIPEIGIGLHGQRFLIDKITENIYWTLLDNYEERDKEKFLINFGNVFESYAFSILKRIFQHKAYKINYGRSKEAGDCIVEIQRHVFIFEIKSGRLIKNIHLTGSKENLFQQYKEKLIIRQIKQISKVIQDFKAGAFKVGKLSFDQVKKIYPICVTFVEIPQFELIRKELDEIVVNKKMLQGSKIQPFQIMDIEEIEILEALLTKKFQRNYFLDLMKQKCGNYDFKANSFLNMLHRLHGSIIYNIESDTIENGFYNIANRVSEIMFGRKRKGFTKKQIGLSD